MLAIKINIVLEININGSSSADQRESTGYLVLLIKVTLHLKISWLATSKFIEVLKENEEKEMKGKWRANEETGRSSTRT